MLPLPTTDTQEKYLLLKDIGQGGMGKVYRAENILTKKPVVIKILPHTLADSEDARIRFLNEQAVTLALSHPFLVQGIEPVTVEEKRVPLPGIVMEYVPGTSLADLVVGEQPLRAEDAAGITVQLALALDYLHRHGLVHRDVSGHNVILRQPLPRYIFHHLCLFDFGLAKAFLSNSNEDSAPLNTRRKKRDAALWDVQQKLPRNFSSAGHPVGTIDYFSPEQARGDAVIDGRSDLYSAGIILYHLIAGRLPFSGGTSLSCIHRQISEPPPPFAASKYYVPTHLDAICLKLLEKDPDKRYQTGRELAYAVLNALPDDKRADVMYQHAVGLLGFDWMRESQPVAAIPEPARVMVSSEPTSFLRGCE